LTSQADAERHVELVRCSACDTSTWRVDGAVVDQARALGALSAVFGRTTPHAAPRRVRTSSTRKGSVAAAKKPSAGTGAGAGDLADLLAGWRVLGA
jgi:hypothetical protein